MNIATFNAGSSSLSTKLLAVGTEDHISEILSFMANRVGVRGTVKGHVSCRVAEGASRIPVTLRTHAEAAERILGLIREHAFPIDCIGHRFVHGGSEFDRSCWIDPAVLGRLELCRPLAPIHNPNSLSVIGVTQATIPLVRQYVAFDTTFHRSLPAEATTYALPFPSFLDPRMRKAGFYGLSHQYQDVTTEAARFLKRPVMERTMVAYHLGTGGASVAAIRDGGPVDTSMGATPTAGLVMSARSGDLDPMIPLELADCLPGGTKAARHLLNRDSALLGLSGVSSDIRDLVTTIRDPSTSSPGLSQARAALAFDVYIHRLTAQVGRCSPLPVR
ncbi:acetate kinase [Candidatus Bipolaricaulota bacterium]|nr:acetate kinase [Candidatus Bipolaricaulota bacterium]